MSTARTWAVALTGVDGHMVEVEADLSSQTPGFQIIGLPDKALGEAAQRVRNACVNAGLDFPRRRLTVNLSPANLPKAGSGFDLSVAVATLATTGALRRESVRSTVHIGELGLDGRLRPVPGVLPAVYAAARAGFTKVIVPHANAAEARLVPGVEVHAAVSLAEVAVAHGAEIDVVDTEPVQMPAPALPAGEPLDLADVIGQDEAVDALITAAAGGHHMMLSGPPGAGKTMLARRLPGILPTLSESESLEVAAIRSLTGETVTRLDPLPPFEAPHHSASAAALVGGGSRSPRPGAIVRAHRGVLFLDETPEFQRAALDALRQPLESGRIEIIRAGFAASFPARFQLVLAMTRARAATTVCAGPSARARRWPSAGTRAGSRGRCATGSTSTCRWRGSRRREPRRVSARGSRPAWHAIAWPRPGKWRRSGGEEARGGSTARSPAIDCARAHCACRPPCGLRSIALSSAAR